MWHPGRVSRTTTHGERDALPRQSRYAATHRVAKRPGSRAEEDRYRAGARRTSGEPLQASWRPAPGHPPRGPGKRPRRRKGLRRLVSTYGWRIYALPILVVLTALVVFDTVREDGSGANAASGPLDAARNTGADPSSQPAPPEATEQPPGPVDVNIPSAELPGGGNFTTAGAGTFHVLPGSGPKVGTAAKVYTYTVEVEDGIDPASFGGEDTFAKLVDETLADPRGWTGGGDIAVQRVDAGFANPSVRITLATPETVHRPDKCGYAIKYESSCYRRADKQVLINLARWVRGAVAFGGDMGTYRQYAINHEIGHAFNNGHVGCATEGALAPVMMQQTFGVANNFVAQLNEAVGNRDPVVADGKTCKPNAWPNPQAKPA
jgi:hypothetical protein